MPSVRLFGIPALKAPVVGLIRRGPSAWCQVSAWYPEEERVEAGAWIRGKIYPQRSDVSPCGDWLVSMIYKVGGRSDWKGGDCWENLSRLPWLNAHRVEAATTYHRGSRFIKGGKKPFLEGRLPVQFAVERERGWKETSNTPARETGGMWDEKRSVTMVKERPGPHRHRLFVRGWYPAFREFAPEPSEVYYSLSPGGELPGVQWADWDARGRLLVATFEGQLQVWDGKRLDDHALHGDLSGTRPDPSPAPDWALTPKARQQRAAELKDPPR